MPLRLEQQFLSYLELRGIGPAAELTFTPGQRLSMVAGDNGLGKSFLLECAWWVLTGQWAGLPAYPREDAQKGEPKIVFQVADASGVNEKAVAHYDWDNSALDKWIAPSKRPTLPGLLVYMRVDGSFAVYDPARLPAPADGKAAPRAFVFHKDEILDGPEGEANGRRRPRINGLLRDWVSWQNSPEKHPWGTFVKVLERLSPPSVGDLGALKPGEPTRIPDDSREIPTLSHPYGTVPFIYTSAGVQRIVSLAYLLVWAWHEHKINSKALRRDEPERRMVILVDEIEAHLHPQWQRSILPALLEG